MLSNTKRLWKKYAARSPVRILLSATENVFDSLLLTFGVLASVLPTFSLLASVLPRSPLGRRSTLGRHKSQTAAPMIERYEKSPTKPAATSQSKTMLCTRSNHCSCAYIRG